MKASSFEMGSRERGNCGRGHRFPLLNVAYDSESFPHAPLMRGIFNTLLLEFLIGFIFSNKTRSPELLSRNNPKHSRF